jgi:CNT family concentrative nucleoside transporter
MLAFRALPLVLVGSALSALLFHWRILPVVVKAFAWLLNRSMGRGGAVGVSSAVNVFVGMVEAPLVVKPYLARLSRSELFMVMVCGMATIAGTVMALYGAILAPVVPDAIGHIIIASFVATPAAIVVAALMVPGEMSHEDAVEIPRQTRARWTPSRAEPPKGCSSSSRSWRCSSCSSPSSTSSTPSFPSCPY